MLFYAYIDAANISSNYKNFLDSKLLSIESRIVCEMPPTTSSKVAASSVNMKLYIAIKGKGKSYFLFFLYFCTNTEK
jgi:hypothetical protein